MKSGMSQELRKAGKNRSSAAPKRSKAVPDVRERPILMCGEMVRATLAGIKMQTRRVVNPKLHDAYTFVENGRLRREARWGSHLIEYPYGEPGDRLWLKQTHWRFGRWMRNGISPKTGRHKWRFRVDPLHRHLVSFEPPLIPPKRTSKGWHRRPSIFMPRSAARIFLQITGVRVERVREITAADVVAEGVTYTVQPSEKHPGKCAVMWNISAKFKAIDYIAKEDRSDPDKILIAHYAALWDSLNAHRGTEYTWAANPWVWVVEFRTSSPTLISKSPADCVLAQRQGGR